MNYIFKWQNNAQVSKMFLPREKEVHIFKVPCNVVFII